jgi:hypothetical protein
MKRYSPSFLVLFILSVVIFSSCKKEGSTSGVVIPPAPTTKENLNKLFAALRTPVQMFTIDGGKDKVIHGALGTRLRFYVNSFRDRDGSIVSSGKINIHLVEVNTAGGMIANRLTTTASGKLLISRGMAYIKAYKNGEEIFPTRYSIGFRNNSGASTQPMGLFYGNSNNEDSVVTWIPTTNTPGTFASETVIDSTISTSTFIYRFDSCTQFNWVSANMYFNTTAQQTNSSVVVRSTDFNNTNTQVYMVFPGMNIVTLMGSYNKNDNIFNLQSGYLVPVGTTVHYVGIGNKNGLLYYDEFKNATSSSAIPDTLWMEPKNVTDIMNALGGL